MPLKIAVCLDRGDPIVVGIADFDLEFTAIEIYHLKFEISIREPHRFQRSIKRLPLRAAAILRIESGFKSSQYSIGIIDYRRQVEN